MRNSLVFSALAAAILTQSARAEDPAPGEQVEQSFTASSGASVPYLLYLPEGYAADGDGNGPVMLFLHGRGESNGALSIVAKWGPPRMAARGDSLPYILVSPQCPRESFWSKEDQQALLIELLDHVAATYKTDPARTYLTGLSMGGFGSWRLAADHPERFAAVAPVCGIGDPADAEKLKDVPIWAWHGTEDGAVPYSGSAEVVEAIKKAGGTKVRLTTLQHIGHNSWSAAYATPQLYDWFNAHTK